MKKHDTIDRPLYAAITSVLLAMNASVWCGEQATNFIQDRFKFEYFCSGDGSLYRSPGLKTNQDDHVTAIEIDSSDNVWVGTQTGLAIYNSNKWTTRTFAMTGAPSALRAVIKVLGIDQNGPWQIVEGSSGTIWLRGLFGVFRFSNGTYEELGAEAAGTQPMAVDRNGALWVIDRFRVLRYDGRAWNTVLCPFIGKPRSVSASGFNNIVVETNGNIWIGATTYGELREPWEHEGLVWVVNQERRERDGGPPMAPLFMFDGKRWVAFGPAQGLSVFHSINDSDAGRGTARGWASPQANGEGRVIVRTPNGYYIRDGDTWRPANDTESDAGKRWILQERNRGLLRGYSELLYRDGQHWVEVQPADARTGEILDIRSEQLAGLHIVEDRGRDCVWLGTSHGLYRIWLEKKDR
jgi:ligand-binding sensor domain-containing protein